MGIMHPNDNLYLVFFVYSFFSFFVIVSLVSTVINVLFLATFHGSECSFAGW